MQSTIGAKVVAIPFERRLDDTWLWSFVQVNCVADRVKQTRSLGDLLKQQLWHPSDHSRNHRARRYVDER